MATEVRRVSESITCLRRASYLTCSYIVRTAKGLVLVDAGMDSDGADVLAGLHALNADVKDVRAILLTHWHNDHSAGALVLDDFEVIATPGHTSGHVSYYYRPEGALFAGDALAVIDGRIRFMARPVTLDTVTARESLAKVLARQPQIVCPGHREPLTGAAPACKVMADYVRRGGKWPLLG